LFKYHIMKLFFFLTLSPPQPKIYGSIIDCSVSLLGVFDLQNINIGQLILRKTQLIFLIRIELI
jgi:hypothetical protein